MRQFYLLITRVLTPLFKVGLRASTVVTGQPRVRVMVTNEDKQILLVQGVLSYRRWTFPGGGVNRKESPVHAARRELLEETGIDVKESDLHYVTTLTPGEVNISFVAPVYKVQVKKSELPKKQFNRWEIADSGWFNRRDLPEPLSIIVDATLSEVESRR